MGRAERPGLIRDELSTDQVLAEDCDDWADEGTCDECDKPHCNSSTEDHCAECGNCWDHCAGH
jgi:hypothetical protein